ncbi:hypothetical protein Cs7R123_61580 [Catellatospora sp. TT07R-123]|uniref:hypothetical protein n=1 Tax=Catellatospora sp. TT07R-123 TaxID=2733863 RepID=UPI001B26F357|nr:hypothetical protein [Catellatospora sp. TT07R-123]GHJ48816.1 hypothetical protein Cs7R123_61580 [Catellatospora sp. TT07R-123]
MTSPSGTGSSPLSWPSLLGWLLGVGGVVAALVGLTNTEFVSAVFLGVCWVPIAATLVSRNSLRWVHWANAALLSVVLAAIGVVFKFQGHPESSGPVASPSASAPAPSPSLSPAAGPSAPTATITMVAPADGATGVPACFDVRFTGDWPAGLTPAVAVKGEHDDRYYFEGEVGPDPQAKGGYAASVTLGAKGDRGAERFGIRVVLLPAPWHDYLMGTTEEANATWWSSMNLPPGAILGDPLTVTRSPGVVTC